MGSVGWGACEGDFGVEFGCCLWGGIEHGIVLAGGEKV